MFRLRIHFHHITGTENQQALVLILTTPPGHNRTLKQRYYPTVAGTCILSCWCSWSAACRPCCMWPARHHRWLPSCSPGWYGRSLRSNYFPQFLHSKNVKRLLRRTIKANTSLFITVIKSKGLGLGPESSRWAMKPPQGRRNVFTDQG